MVMLSKDVIFPTSVAKSVSVIHQLGFFYLWSEGKEGRESGKGGREGGREGRKRKEGGKEERERREGERKERVDEGA